MDEGPSLPKKCMQEKVIPISEVKKILEAKNGAELDQFQQRTLDYTVKFSKIDPKRAEELMNKLVEKFALEIEEAVQIVNCMPSSIEELRVFFTAGKRKIIASTQLEEMLKILDECRKKE
jgi:DNA-directed RNA polymerase subunit F